MLHINITTGTEAKSRDVVTEFSDIRVLCTTVHKSKGLEYGLVILPFTDSEIGSIRKNSVDVTYIDGKVGYCLTGDKSVEICNDFYHSALEIKEKQMEEARILYVAMTRAINRFIWFTRTDSNTQSWGSLLKELESYGD